MKYPFRRQREAPGSGWLITFADLMTLLLTFFILLLSFSNIDAQKYKMIAQSMAVSFGVSWIQGQPPPVIVEVPVDTVAPGVPEIADPTPVEPPEEVVLDRQTRVIDPNVESLAENLIKDLEDEIASKSMSVAYDDKKVVVRFSQDATFPTASAELKEGMNFTIDRIVDALSRCEGDIIVSGYTDDRPISSGRFRSNWDLSAARAVSVVHELIDGGRLNPERIMAAGHADTNALVSNDEAADRAKNRRVEIKVFNPDCGS